MSWQKKRYLHRKLAVSVFWAALLFAAFIAMLSFLVEFKRVSEKNRILLEQLLDTVESTAAVAAYSGNRAIGEDVLKGLMRNDIVREARLSNGLGLDLRQARAGPAAEISLLIEGTPAAQAELVRTLRSPFGDEESIGTLSVVPDIGFSLKEVSGSALIATLNSAAVIGMTAIILLFLVRTNLSRPLMTVSDALHTIRAGESERLEALSRHENDELGQLVEDINSLLDKVQEKFEDERLLTRQIQAVEKQLRSLFENTSAGIFLLDGHGRLRTANRTLGRVLGLPGGEANSSLGLEFPPLAFAEPAQFHGLMRQAEAGGQAVAADLQLRIGGPGEADWVHCLLSWRTNGDGVPCFEGVVYDITERHAQEMRARHEADHDPLTGLLRRQTVERNLARLLEAPLGGGSLHVLLLLDLDNFKGINDTYGHAAGDAVLVEVARRLRAQVRSGDWVARLGGDEFMIVLVECAPLERACGIARNLVAAVTLPIALGPGLEGRVGVSIGIAAHDGRPQTVAELSHAADQAMYEVKRQGKNGFGLAGADGAVVVERLGPA